jgi:hypothetical protein
MEYMLYTTVDITSTSQYRSEPGKETERWKEQNFQTVLQTLGLRANISYSKPPSVTYTEGASLLGFKTELPVNIWRFDFQTERDHLFKLDNDPIGYLLEDFDAVPYIAGLDESMTQNYNVFVTHGPSTNIVFFQK